MARTSHLHSRHRGTVPSAQVASGTSTSGYVPVANGSGSQVWTNLTASLIPFTPNGSIAATNVQAAIQEVRDEAAGGGGGAGGWEVVGTDGTKLEAGRADIYDATETSHFYLSDSFLELASDEIGLYSDGDIYIQPGPNAGDVVDIADGEGVIFPTLSSDPTAVRNGQVYYNNTTHKLRLRANGAWVDLN
jgi:hypothetical protein